MPLTSDSRVTIIEIAVRLHCASTSLDKDATAVLKTAEAFATFAENESAPVKPTRGKAKPQDPPPVVATDSEPAETAADATPAAEASKPQTSPSPAVSAQTTPAAVSADDVKKAVGDVAKNPAAGGAPKAREILGKYGASNLSTLKPENYAKALAELNAALKSAEDAAALAA